MTIMIKDKEKDNSYYLNEKRFCLVSSGGPKTIACSQTGAPFLIVLKAPKLSLKKIDSA